LVALLRERFAGDVRISVPSVDIPRSTVQIANRPIDEYGPPSYVTKPNDTRVA